MNRLTVFAILIAGAVTLADRPQAANACWFTGGYGSYYGPTYGVGYRSVGYSSYYRPSWYGYSSGYRAAYAPVSFGTSAAYTTTAYDVYSPSSPCFSCASSCGGCDQCGSCDPCGCAGGNCATGNCAGGDCLTGNCDSAQPQTFTQPTPVEPRPRDDRPLTPARDDGLGTPPTFIDEPMRRDEPRPEDPGFRRTPENTYDPDNNRRDDPRDRRDPLDPGFAPRAPDFSPTPADPAAPASGTDGGVPDPLDFGPPGGPFGTGGARKIPADNTESGESGPTVRVPSRQPYYSREQFRPVLPALNLDDKVAWQSAPTRQRTTDRSDFSQPLLIRTGHRSIPGGDTNAGWVAVPAPGARLVSN